MKLNDIKVILEPYIDEPIVNFQIKKELFDDKHGRKSYNETIRKNVSKKYDVYIWIDNATDDIVYIGMAGKIKTDGATGDHSIQHRLLASRGKEKETKKDIQTNDYVKNLMANYNIDAINFYIIYSQTGEPPAYLEALLLYKYYKTNNSLPRFNNSFWH